MTREGPGGPDVETSEMVGYMLGCIDIVRGGKCVEMAWFG
jgi:hypothetical protein